MMPRVKSRATYFLEISFTAAATLVTTCGSKTLGTINEALS
jgi:hypothetical protein